MHEETVRELIDGLFTIGGSLAKEEFVHRKRQETMEQKQEHELELAKVRNNVREDVEAASGGEVQKEELRQSSTPGASVPPREEPDTTKSAASIEEAVAVGDSLVEQLDLAAAATTCGFCIDIIEDLRRQDEATTRAGLEELVQYERVKDRLIDEGAGEQQMAEEMGALFDELEVVPELVHPVA